MKIVVLAGAGSSTNILLNWLEDKGYDQVFVIVEKSPTHAQTVRSRMKRLGVAQSVGQVLFALCVVPVSKRRSRNRRQEILAEHKLRDDIPSAAKPVNVETVNSTEVIKLLHNIDPEVVLVNGARIIKSDILNSVAADFLNIHAGITPEYRGVHGGYWSLWSDDRENFGVTLHMVDAGVDTGRIVAQHRINPGALDNFSSYPLLQQATAFPLLDEALQAIKDGQSLETIKQETTNSRQWFHPTLWQYIGGYLRGVR